MSNSINKAKAAIKAIESKDVTKLTGYDLQRLANNYLKVEQKSLNYVYKTLKANYTEAVEKISNGLELSGYEHSLLALTGTEFPTLSKFRKAYNSKFYSLWAGMSALRNCNDNYKRKTRAKKQEKAQAAKA